MSGTWSTVCVTHIANLLPNPLGEVERPESWIGSRHNTGFLHKICAVVAQHLRKHSLIIPDVKITTTIGRHILRKCTMADIGSDKIVGKPILAAVSGGVLDVQKVLQWPEVKICAGPQQAPCVYCHDPSPKILELAPDAHWP